MTPRRPASGIGPGAEEAFDRALGAAARSLAAEALPGGVLEAPPAARGEIRSG